MKKSLSLICLFLSLITVFAACQKGGSSSSTTADNKAVVTTAATEPTEAATESSENLNTDYFSKRDFEADYDEASATEIFLKGNSAACNSSSVSIDGSLITVTKEGTYILSGKLDDGMIIVNTDKSQKVQLVLKGADINSETSAAIYVPQSDKVFLTLAPDTDNKLSNSGVFTPIDESNIDSVIFSKEDLTINGSGSLTISSPAGHGIASKDSLTVTGGAISISSASHGIAGKDDICIADAAVTIASGKDGLHAENDESAESGFIFLKSGSYDITSEGDGISSGTYAIIDGGEYRLLTGGGSGNATKKTSYSRGGHMNGPGGMGKPGSQQTTSESSEDSISTKGIKAAGDITINGGSFRIDSADDGIHSNSSVTVNGGSFDIASGDDGFHADDTLTVAEGEIKISESYEGLEALHLRIDGGSIDLVASDDGLNAAGGTDESGYGGHHGGDVFGPSGGGSQGTIIITDGTISITASGDGIDSNGSLEISGGYVTVCGPAQGDTSTLDYDTTAVISGGTFLGTGASGMAQTFGSSPQGVIAVSVGNCSAGTEFILKNDAGKEILSCSPPLSYAVVIFSSPEIISGESYSISIGSQNGSFTAN